MLLALVRTRFMFFAEACDMKQTPWRSLICSIQLYFILLHGSQATSSLDLSPEVIQLKDSVSQNYQLSEREPQVNIDL